MIEFCFEFLRKFGYKRRSVKRNCDIELYSREEKNLLKKYG